MNRHDEADEVVTSASISGEGDRTALLLAKKVENILRDSRRPISTTLSLLVSLEAVRLKVRENARRMGVSEQQICELEKSAGIVPRVSRAAIVLTDAMGRVVA